MRQRGSLVRRRVEAAADQLFELAIPFRSLGLKTDEPVHFYIELLQGASRGAHPARRRDRNHRAVARLRTDYVASVTKGFQI